VSANGSRHFVQRDFDRPLLAPSLRQGERESDSLVSRRRRAVRVFLVFFGHAAEHSRAFGCRAGSRLHFLLVLRVHRRLRLDRVPQQLATHGLWPHGPDAVPGLQAKEVGAERRHAHLFIEA